MELISNEEFDIFIRLFGNNQVTMENKSTLILCIVYNLDESEFFWEICQQTIYH